FIYVANGGEGVGNSYVLEASLQGLIESGLASNPGNARITVGHFSPAVYNAAFEQSPTTATTFELDVTITDGASGQSGVASFFGFGSTVVTTGWPPNPISLQLLTPASQTLVLGGNSYDVSLSSTPAVWGGNGDVVAAVSLSPAATPEPATIALAGLGFVGLLGWRNAKGLPLLVRHYSPRWSDQPRLSPRP
ncbi:MAG TPA: PEP-CTERM sorting domain-containing protein, partial [Urbifossiella sp.]